MKQKEFTQEDIEIFTDFSCERLDGKQGYIASIENLLSIDGTAKIFVQVYGLEEDNNEQCICADNLIFIDSPTNQQFIILENSKMIELSKNVEFSFWKNMMKIVWLYVSQLSENFLRLGGFSCNLDFTA